jgi:hypothetical protein
MPPTPHVSIAVVERFTRDVNTPLNQTQPDLPRFIVRHKSVVPIRAVATSLLVRFVFRD